MRRETDIHPEVFYVITVSSLTFPFLWHKSQSKSHMENRPRISLIWFNWNEIHRIAKASTLNLDVSGWLFFLSRCIVGFFMCLFESILKSMQCFDERSIGGWHRNTHFMCQIGCCVARRWNQIILEIILLHMSMRFSLLCVCVCVFLCFFSDGLWISWTWAVQSACSCYHLIYNDLRSFAE